MKPLLAQLLNLPGIEVEDYHELGDELILEVEAIRDFATCPRCRQESHHLHQNRGHLVRDLNISIFQVLLRVNRRQFKCKTCGKPFSEELDFIGRRRRHTDRFAEMIVKQVIHSDIHNVAKNNDLTDAEVWSMVKYLSKKKWTLDLSDLRRLGIDEITLRKGQSDYVVVLVDLDKNELIGLAPSRKHEDIEEVLKSWGDEVLNQIIEVSIDLSGNYKSLVKKCIQNAEIVADRFHVMKLVNEEFNKVRNREKKAIEKNPNTVEKERLKEAFKQSKYALLKPEESLTEKQKLKLEEIKEVSPILAEMHQQKEAFRNIFETAKDWRDGAVKLLAWMKKAQENFQDSVSTIGRWFGEITNYFDSRTTSGAVEGINNRLKLIKRSGYGFRNFENFRLRCLMCWHLNLSSA
ncbi:MAG: ISL3 family transposase [Pseudanabaenales cyanobacterium]|nr:ISL3 family transposase [Pseudanabaenales cyanobacterium]